MSPLDGVGSSVSVGVLVTAAVLLWPGSGPRDRLTRLLRSATARDGPPVDAPVLRRWAQRLLARARALLRPGPSQDEEMVLLVGQLASLARGGVDLSRAMHFLAGQPHDRELRRLLGGAASAVTRGDSVAGYLLEASRDQPTSAAAIRPLALLLWITQVSGAPTAEALGHLAQSLADDADAARAVESALAGPRSSARVLTALPLIGLGLGYAIGADPLGTLIGTAVGRFCLLAGCGLAWAGWWWSRRLIALAAAPPPAVDGRSRVASPAADQDR